MNSFLSHWRLIFRLGVGLGLALFWGGCASGPLTPEDRMLSLRPLYGITAPTVEELAALEQMAGLNEASGRRQVHNGVTFRQVSIQGRPCLLFVSGVSVVNAAMTTQAALDRFPLTHVVLLGSAGGVNPAREPGDVVIPENWAYHTEAAFVNPRPGGGWEVSPQAAGLPNFGMIFPENVSVVRSGSPRPEPMPLFPVDRGLFAVASKVASEANLPGSGVGRVVSAGTGVSGPVFVANRDYRIWLSEAWQAEVVDLESTAVAQVCWANRVPFIAVRVVAGLAGSPPARPPEESPVDRAARVLLAMLNVLPD